MEATVQAEGLASYSDGFKGGFEAAKRLFSGTVALDDLEDVRKLPVGSCIKDNRDKVWFRTTANGWVSIAATHTSTMYLALPVIVLYHN